MKIAHMALWTTELEAQARFWTGFFGGTLNEKYISKNNPGFESYFVRIGDDIAIELMTKPALRACARITRRPGGCIWQSRLAVLKKWMRWQKSTGAGDPGFTTAHDRGRLL